MRRITAAKNSNDDDFLFQGEAKILESIGMGYGRRLTFTGDSPNYNDCFFWSDSEPRGFAFSIQAVRKDQRFVVVDKNDMVVGEAAVIKADHRQEETSTQIDDVTGRIRKRVRVRLMCEIKYHQRPHRGLLELMSAENVESMSGDAVVGREKGSRKASLFAVENVCLQLAGPCKLIPEL